MIGHRREPVEIREHLFLAHHDRLDAIGDIEHLHVVRSPRQRARDFLDHLVARIGDGVHRMPEADHHFLVANARDDVVFGFVRRLVAVHHLEPDFVRPAVLGAAQRPDRAGDR
ncbi:hypothetical protein D3C83_24390 [compost metagenome]